jgi:hypothetical protein
MEFDISFTNKEITPWGGLVLNHNVSEYFYSWIFDHVQFNNFTLDLDASVMTRYGVQEGAKRVSKCIVAESETKGHCQTAD